MTNSDDSYDASQIGINRPTTHSSEDPTLSFINAAKPVYTLEQEIYQLRTSWGVDYTNSWHLNGDINYIIPVSAYVPSGFSQPIEKPGATALTSGMKLAAEYAFSLLDDLISKSIKEITSPQTNSIQVMNSSTTSGGGTYASTWKYNNPSQSNYAGLSEYPIARVEVWFNSNWSTHDQDSDLFLNGQPVFGSYGFITYLHEFSHSIGLSHPGEYNADQGGISYSASAVFAQDTRKYTIMSYWQAYADGSGTDHYGSDNIWKYASTPLLLDIAALQAIYGADTTTRTENTIYGFNCTANRSVFNFAINLNPIICIWDAGGNDTLDCSGFSTNQIIDLTAGSFSSVGYMTDNVSIAYGCVIENATGGAGNDIIWGNSSNNTLIGGNGNDSIFGGAGNDIITGGDGLDIFIISGPLNDYRIRKNAGIYYLNNTGNEGEGEDTLQNIEYIYSLYQNAYVTLSDIDFTPPEASTFSPADEATAVAVGVDIVVTFNENIQRGIGDIVLKTAAGVVIETYTQSSSNVTISGSTLTINPSNNLNYRTTYKVEFGSSSVQDLSGNNCASINAYNFTTGGPPNQLPTSNKNSIAIIEDVIAIINKSIFTFNDADKSQTLNKVVITSSPTLGTLKLNATAVDTNQEISIADIEAGKLTYVTAINGNGAGYATMQFKVNDGIDSSASSYTMTFNVTAVNDAPTVANAIADQSATEVTAFSLSVANAFTDVDAGDKLTLTATLADGKTKLPAWLAFNAATGAFSGTPKDADSNKTVSVMVKATDAAKAFSTDTFDIVITGVNCAPVVKPITAAAKATENTQFSYAIPKGTFTDPDAGDVLTYSAVGLPQGLSINATTGAITGKPDFTAADNPIRTIALTATDKAGLSASTNLTLNITNVAAITGTYFDDTLVGGAGADIITGGAGNDSLTGRSGADQFKFDVLPGVTNKDTITDFVNGTDKLLFSLKIFSALGKKAGAVSSDQFVQGAGVTQGQDATDRLVFNTGTSTLYYDADGSGAIASVAVAVLTGITSLTAGTDLVLY
jgi:Ca2+-binding RTX toxin-like protein